MSRLFLLFFCLMACSVRAHQIIPPEQDLELVAFLGSQDIRLIVMRHGEATHDLRQIVTSCQSPGICLTEKGLQQAKQAAAQLMHSGEKIDKIYVSPLYRALQTAHAIGTELQMPYQKIKVHESLKEQYFGNYEGRASSDYFAYFKDPEDACLKAVPQGEPGTALYERMRRFLWKECLAHPHKTILIITHGFNCCQLNKCLTGSFCSIPQQAEYKNLRFSSINRFMIYCSSRSS